MVDWSGLFKWSMAHNDGTKPSEFKMMSPEDRKWLEEALKQYTFNDNDRQKECIAQLKSWTGQTDNDADNQNATQQPSTE